MNAAEFGQKIKQQHPEYADIPDAELGSKVLAKYPQYSDMVDQGIQSNPVYQAVNALTFGLPQGAIESYNRLGQQNPNLKPITSDMNLGQKIGTVANDINPLNLLAGFAHDIGPAAVPAAETAGAYYGIPTLLKALAPYLTYNGINQLKDKMTNQDPNAFQGKDIQSSLVDKLGVAGKLGNVKSDAETFINNLLTKQMPGGYSNQGTYTTGDIAQLGKNIGTGETGGYDTGTVANTIRGGATQLVKDVLPQAQNLYKATNFLQKLPGPLKNPWTWPVAATGGLGLLNKIPGWLKSVTGVSGL